MKEKFVSCFRIERLRISGRKDWAIFWFFAGMIAYVAGDVYGDRTDRWLGEHANPWITDLNVPSGYGRVIVAAILLAVTAEVILFLCRKPRKAKLAVPVAALLFSLAAVGMYQVHCRLIVSVLWEEVPQSVVVWQKGSPCGLIIMENGSVTDESRELLELCRNLEVITDSEELEECMVWYKTEGDFLCDNISVKFSEKYGHSYSLTLHVQDGHVFLWRGYRGYEPRITFFRDNGILDWMNGISGKDGAAKREIPFSPNAALQK